jgi:hypothetical protein
MLEAFCKDSNAELPTPPPEAKDSDLMDVVMKK